MKCISNLLKYRIEHHIVSHYVSFEVAKEKSKREGSRDPYRSSEAVKVFLDGNEWKGGRVDV